MVSNFVGQRIRQYRKKSGLSQEKLAEKTGLSVIAISNIERGVNYPAFEHFISIANALNVSADMLMIDVVDNACMQEASKLSDRLSKVNPNKRQQILAVVEMMLLEQ